MKTYVLQALYETYTLESSCENLSELIFDLASLRLPYVLVKDSDNLELCLNLSLVNTIREL